MNEVYILFRVGFDSPERFLVAVFTTGEALHKWVEDKLQADIVYEKGLGGPGAYEWDRERVLS